MKAKYVYPVLVTALAIPAVAGTTKSGLQVGAMAPAFEPTHVTGVDKGTNTCPVCKYGNTPAVQVWVNGDSAANVGKIAAVLEREISKHGAEDLKAFVVYIKEGSAKGLQGRLSKLAREHHLKNVALTYVSGPKDEAVSNYHINTNPEIKNTVLVYSGRRIRSNFVNLKADANGVKQLTKAVEGITK